MVPVAVAEARNLRVANRALGPGYPCFLVAEVSGNHNGDLKRALALVDAISQTGADAVKFQAFTMDEILALRGTGPAPAPWQDFTLPELYAQVRTPLEWFPALFSRARQRGLMPFASIFGPESLACVCAPAVDSPLLKLAKPERDRLDLRALAQETGRPLLISGRDLYCPGGYPCQPKELRLHELRRWFGLSNHCPHPVVGPLAVSYGAHYLECHVTLDDGVPTLDDCVNFRVPQFRELVTWTRQAEAMR